MSFSAALLRHDLDIARLVMFHTTRLDMSYNYRKKPISKLMVLPLHNYELATDLAGWNRQRK